MLHSEGEATRSAWADYEAAEQSRWETEQNPRRIVRVLSVYYQPHRCRVIAWAERANGEKAWFHMPQAYDHFSHQANLEFIWRLDAMGPEELAKISYGPLPDPVDYDPRPGAVNYIEQPPSLFSRLFGRA